MKIAYLFFVYKNPLLIDRTIARLTCDDSAFFIHVDVKSDIDQFKAIRGHNVFFTEKRIPVYWAEFSGVEAEFLLISEALRAPESYDYLVLLSGSEYPLRSRQYIHRFFEYNRGCEFMTLIKVPNEEAGKPLSRINTIRYPSTRPLFRFTFRALAKLGLAQRDYRKHFGNWEPYAGRTWWALSREACQYLVDFKKRDQQLMKFFQKAFAPEESYIQTILGNSPFRARMRRNLVFEDWFRCNGHPAMINEKHLLLFHSEDKVSVPDLHGTGEYLFARKFSDESLSLTEKIDEMIKRKEGFPCRV
jgi:hypothetical protein